jgi:hypothetical protein
MIAFVEKWLFSGATSYCLWYLMSWQFHFDLTSPFEIIFKKMFSRNDLGLSTKRKTIIHFD